MNGDSGKVLDSPVKILEMERNCKGKLSEIETREKDRKAFQLFQGGKERNAVHNNWTDDHVWPS